MLTLGSEVGRMIGGNEDEITVITLVVNTCAKSLCRRLKVVHTVAVNQGRTEIFHRVKIDTEVEHEHRLHGSEGVENFEIFLVEVLLANHVEEEVTACAASYDHVAFVNSAVSEANSLCAAVLNYNLVNHGVVDDLAAVGRDTVGQSLGHLLTTAVNVAEAGVIALAVLIKRNSLVKGCFGVGEDNRQRLCLGGCGAEVGKNACVKSLKLLGFEEVLYQLLRAHIRQLFDLHECKGEASLVDKILLLSSDVTQMHYVIVEFVVCVDAVLFLGEKLLQPFSSPIRTAVLLRSNHVVVWHDDVSVRTGGGKVDAKGGEEFADRLTGEHITYEERTLLKFIAIMLEKGYNAAGRRVFVVNRNLVAVLCRKGTEGETAKACTDNINFHYTFCPLLS